MDRKCSAQDHLRVHLHSRRTAQALEYIAPHRAALFQRPPNTCPEVLHGPHLKRSQCRLAEASG